MLYQMSNHNDHTLLTYVFYVGSADPQKIVNRKPIYSLIAFLLLVNP